MAAFVPRRTVLRRPRLATRDPLSYRSGVAIDLSQFTPWPSLVGGLLIGASAAAMFVLEGRIAGISGIVGGVVRPRAGDVSWRATFLAGLFAGGLVLRFAMPASFDETPASLPVLVVAGLLVGFGTRLGNGCTSGHGVCGLGRRSPRSLAATLTFMLTGALSAFVVHHLVLGGAR